MIPKPWSKLNLLVWSHLLLLPLLRQLVVQIGKAHRAGLIFEGVGDFLCEGPENRRLLLLLVARIRRWSK